MALCSCGAAVMLANAAGLISPGTLAALHASRLDGGSINQLQTEVAALRKSTAELRRANELLVQRLDRGEAADKAATQRLGALESTVPQILESLTWQTRPTVDTSAITGSIGAAEPDAVPAEGGSVRVVQRPFQPSPELEPDPEVAAVPAASATAEPELGIALGPAMDAPAAAAQWQMLQSRVGPLLLGLTPLLSQAEGQGGTRIVAGPIGGKAEAEALCERMSKVAIACAPVPYAGEPLPAVN